MYPTKKKHIFFSVIIIFLCFHTITVFGQETRLLRQPDINDSHIVYTYGADVWVNELGNSQAKRITSTSAVESNPYISPDGKWIAFSSNRSGQNAVYVVSIKGGEVKRLTWHPNGASVRGWTNDGKSVLYASSRETAPRPYNRLWTVPVKGGAPSLISKQWGFDGSFSENGKSIVIDKMSRWDVEWRAYRGGQNTPLIVLDTKTSKETLLPHNNSTDIQPLWIGENIYFLSDRDLVMNIWQYNITSKTLSQLTKFKGSDIKWLSGHKNMLTYERDGYLHTFNLSSYKSAQLDINVIGDFPWAETKFENVTKSATSSSLSPNGKRAIFESRGEIFTVPLKYGDARNITQSSGTADRAPIWSPKGNKIAWFSDKDRKGYALFTANQDGMSDIVKISIGESKMAWNPTWSPDGKYIGFVDDDVRLRIVNLETKKIKTIDVGGNNIERSSIILNWAPDSNWIAYEKSGSNNFRQIYIWSKATNKSTPITDAFADSFSPVWDLNKKQMYFLASTNVALGSGWANTSAMTSNPSYAAYVVNLNKKDASPFKPKSDEEIIKKEKDEEQKKENKKDAKPKTINIDFEGLSRRTFPLNIPSRNYWYLLAGKEGTVFIAESIPNQSGATLKKYNLKDKKAKDFISVASSVSITNNGEHMLARVDGNWKVIETAGSNGKTGKPVKVNLQMKLNRIAEWEQMFEEAYRYERDYFYDPNIHGRDWKIVYKRYAPLVPFIKHRADLNYVLDQVNGELSVGHSFVRGGDFPSIDKSQVGLLGADLDATNKYWKINRIYTTESWNPGLNGPLDAPDLNIKEGYFIVGINGKEITTDENIYEFLNGTNNKQTILHINSNAQFKDSWKETVLPIRSENGLRQRTWVEDNRRLVEKLSDGRLGYVWVPNTGGPGYVSFNRYYFAQQDKEGAVIDERFNGGGLLDDYMVDLMTRSLRAGLTNEVPNGKPFTLPAGILGPKVLLINELAGSGGDFFPWVFRQQKAGKLIGMTTWGGLVKSSTHYRLIDGGSLTAPDNAVFDPIKNEWIAENKGIAPDIKVRQDAKSLSLGKDPQLERAVKELMKQLTAKKEITPPPFPKPAKGN
ncbi:PDZ domain-containing protein [Polaribacter litorisediminis]|uniref:S41 family peptidase n=1 Tax=Polaribacter litorisediminis TaxID=1908341 RepID=UPI001CBB8EC0|nr:S41 family peptidase [Polaribacter litorisediminis]UAM96722.1 PDZ domain-containing protein [Polaribacter litorisediminis]